MDSVPDRAEYQSVTKPFLLAGCKSSSQMKVRCIKVVPEIDSSTAALHKQAHDQNKMTAVYRQMTDVIIQDTPNTWSQISGHELTSSVCPVHLKGEFFWCWTQFSLGNYYKYSPLHFQMSTIFWKCRNIRQNLNSALKIPMPLCWRGWSTGGCAGYWHVMWRYSLKSPAQFYMGLEKRTDFPKESPWQKKRFSVFFGGRANIYSEVKEVRPPWCTASLHYKTYADPDSSSLV